MRTWEHKFICPDKLDQSREIIDGFVCETFIKNEGEHGPSRQLCLQITIQCELGLVVGRWLKHGDLIISASSRDSDRSQSSHLCYAGRYREAAIRMYRNYDRRLLVAGSSEDIGIALCLLRIDPTVDLFLDDDKASRLGLASSIASLPTPSIVDEIHHWRREWRQAWRAGLLMRHIYPETIDDTPDLYIEQRGSWNRQVVQKAA
ncbi:MAG: hypothetical protein AAF743_00920 [Planctomycetota bacterium]